MVVHWSCEISIHIARDRRGYVDNELEIGACYICNPSFDDFVDERLLVSNNAFGDKEMKIKIFEVSDEIAQLTTKFGDRVKINKIIVTIKHLQNQQIEEGEFDIESIERELTEKVFAVLCIITETVFAN